MSASWKLSAFGQKNVIQSALLVHDGREEWDAQLVISGREIAEDKPDDWVLEAWYPTKPIEAQTSAIQSLFDGKAPQITSEQIADQDWLTLSQQGVDPIHAGRFCVRTPDHDAAPGAIDLVIPASQAFGTGQHETTAGCLTILSQIHEQGVAALNIADIGTGTGLLGFAALKLWPNAHCTASDIDPICAGVVEDNAALNGMMLGEGRGAMTMLIADGMDDEQIQARGPYDVLLANILAGPLIELAENFAEAVTRDGHVVLAGLLSSQEESVKRAYERNGFELCARHINGDWSILWLRKLS